MKSLLLTLLLLPILLQANGMPPEETAPYSDTSMSIRHAVLLGVVEGVTEFLPVSSTGHLLLAERVLKISGDPHTERAVDSYMIIIQMGAILAVAWVYHGYIKRMILGLLGKDTDGRRLFLNILIAFVPAAIVGILFVDVIKERLFDLWMVSFAWLVGGMALVIWGRKSPEASLQETCTLENMTGRQALLIGALQVVAMLPGTSRSLVTILGGKWAGLSLRNSVIFSFLLGLVTLSASTLYDFTLNGAEMINILGAQSLIIGLLTAYFSAWIAVKGMVRYLKNHGMGLFGGYRIALAMVTAGLLLGGWISP